MQIPYRINSNGKIERKIDFSRLAAAMIVPEFVVFSSPSIKIEDIARRRFSLIDKHK